MPATCCSPQSRPRRARPQRLGHGRCRAVSRRSAESPRFLDGNPTSRSFLVVGESLGQPVPKTRAQWIAQHFLEGPIGTMSLVGLSTTRRPADHDPVGGTITLPPEALWVHKRLEIVQWVSIRPPPIRRQLVVPSVPTDAKPGGEPYPRQDQEAEVVGDEIDVSPTRFGRTEPRKRSRQPR